jgi:hypothetical protein
MFHERALTYAALNEWAIVGGLVQQVAAKLACELRACRDGWVSRRARRLGSRAGPGPVRCRRVSRLSREPFQLARGDHVGDVGDHGY